jgi:hypothetical protein
MDVFSCSVFTAVAYFRLMNKPSKHHICDAMDALSTFATSQRKKIVLKAERRKKRMKPVESSSKANARSPSVSTLAISPYSIPTEANSTTDLGSAILDVD